MNKDNNKEKNLENQFHQFISLQELNLEYVISDLMMANSTSPTEFISHFIPPLYWCVLL